MATERVRSITIIVLCEVAVLTLWFSATAVVPALKAEGGLDDHTASLFTSAVQIGFVVGTLASALFGLADRFDGRKLFAACALIGAGANALILFVDPASGTTIGLRFATGVIMAGVYPVGMRLVVAWAKADMGLLVGLLVGALTLGSASPHLFQFLGGLDWRLTLASASVVSVFGAVGILMAREGPGTRRAASFHFRHIAAYWTERPIRYANFGYLGHMWELYAMWAWIGVFLAAAYATHMSSEDARALAALMTFWVIAAGGLGAVVAGFLADRFGRTTIASASMIISGLCALTIGMLFDASPVMLSVVALVWGFSVVADSAQFSASVAELSDPERVGTMMTAQTSVGFLLTLISVHLVPWMAEEWGWRNAFYVLAIGPAFGTYAMLRLRRMPDALKLAGGRR
ncbi:MAG: MFS transporter [Rhodospirillaceae bacterium]|nr:MFS transporter [Rhodospirillaceae bacterium]